MASSSKSRPPKAKQQGLVKQETRDWLELPSDVMAKILSTLSVSVILENAQFVCTSWHKICKDPAIWRAIRMDQYSNQDPRSSLFGPHEFSRKMYKDAVDRSQGQLVDVAIVGFEDAELLQYVANRSSRLRHLEITRSFLIAYDGWDKALKNFPLLEELSICSTPISKEAIEAAGRCCPMLKTLKLNLYKNIGYDFVDEWRPDDIAIAIGENLGELRHLELIGDCMTNVGLQAILDGCRHLQSLDLSDCFNIDVKGDLGKRCSEQITSLKLPSISDFSDYDDYVYDDYFSLYDARDGDEAYDPYYEEYLLSIQ